MVFFFLREFIGIYVNSMKMRFGELLLLFSEMFGILVLKSNGYRVFGKGFGGRLNCKLNVMLNRENFRF